MPFTQYQGFDVLEISPSWDNPATKIVYNTKVLDSKFGKVSAFDRSGLAFEEWDNFHWLMNGRADIQTFRDFVDARKGACIPFWVPSWKFDLPVLSKMASGSTTVVIQNIGYTANLFPYVQRRYIVFRLSASTWYYRKVIASIVTDPNIESLTIDSSVPVDVTANAQVNFLLLSRLAMDDPELIWHSTTVAESTLHHVELPFEVPA